MTDIRKSYVEQWQDETTHLSETGMYSRADERDACGVGLIASLDGQPRRSVVAAGITALKALWHRGAVDADGKTGDGAGIHVQIPQDFFREHVRRSGFEPGEGKLGLGQVFLPKTDLSAQETCRTIVETAILDFGYGIYGWRQAPVDASIIGEKANATRPEIEQVLIENRHGKDDGAFERDLFLIRRRIEKQVLAAHISDFYICSLSCRSVIYKGMFLLNRSTISIPICRTSVSSRPSRSITSAIRPIRFRTGVWPSPSACWPITARSTRCAATSTG